MKVAVLMGGWSAEREVSLTSGRGIAQACRTLGHDVVEIDMGRDVAQRGWARGQEFYAGTADPVTAD